VALGKVAFRIPHSTFLANTVFGVRVAAVVQLHTGSMKLDDGQSAKLELQKKKRGSKRDIVVQNGLKHYFINYTL
jgi:hypothetical protein